MKYYGILRQRENWLKVVIILAAAYMIYLSLTGGMYTYAALGVVAILAVFLRKEQVVSEEGVDIKYDLFGIKHMNRWEWKDISAIKTDYAKKAPNVLVHFNKDVTLRAFVMKRSDIQGIIAIAKKMNRDIYIDDVKRR